MLPQLADGLSILSLFGKSVVLRWHAIDVQRQQNRFALAVNSVDVDQPFVSLVLVSVLSQTQIDLF